MGVLKRITTKRFLYGIAESLIAILALAALTVVSYRFHFHLTIAALLYVIVVVLVSRTSRIVSSVIVSITAAVLLAYLAPPAYSVRIEDPLDIVAIIAFLITSLIIALLVSELRRMRE